jgi:hypothetical protein
MMSAGGIESTALKYQALASEMDERTRRLWAASEARALGYGGITVVAEATGMAISTIRAGLRELSGESSESVSEGESSERRVRRPGAGRKRVTEVDPTVTKALEALVGSTARGDPVSPLLWTCKSTRILAKELTRQGHVVSHTTVASLLDDLGYSLQSNRKTREGSSHPDRNAQFEHIAAKVRAFQRRGQPVISVDAKKKESVGDFKNGGREWRHRGDPIPVRVHDFVDKKLGKANPYGVFDMTRNSGWVSVGTDHDTAEFAVQTIRHWWRQMGRRAYPRARELLITADSGGSNGNRSRLWKARLQQLADETGLCVSVSHFPPGTSKWNKIEHQMFCHITRNWRGRPLETLGVIVNLISNTTTERGLRIRAALDTQRYPHGIKVTDEEMSELNITPDSFHGEWNYVISARRKRKV